MACGSLLERTIYLLINRPKPMTYQKIETDNPGLYARWLSELANGRLDDPSVNKIQQLYEYLSGQPITLV